MRTPLLVLALASITLGGHAQLSLGGHQIGFDVQRKKPSTPTVTLVPGNYVAGEKSTLQFQVKNIDDSKGITVYSQQPCVAAQNAQKVSDGLYKVDVTIESSNTDGSCQVTLISAANKQQNATVSVPYKNNTAAIAKNLADVNAFLAHNTWVGTTSTGTSYTLHPDNSMMGVASQQAAAQHMVMLRDPKLPIPMMLVVQMPNKVSFTRLGCIMDGTFNGSKASLKPSAMRPADTCPDGAVTLEGK
jgi:hypothetical protein